jgi:hypothetical protein
VDLAAQADETTNSARVQRPVDPRCICGSIAAGEPSLESGLVAERHIKIALCELPTMLDDIITVLVGDEPNVDIVARIRRTDDLRSDFERTGADLLICSVDEREMETLWEDAVRRSPLPAFLNVGGDSTRASLYSTHTAELRLEELTARSLLGALQDHLRTLPGDGHL